MSDIIAWLVPTARNSLADKTTYLACNISRTVQTTSSTTLTSRLPNLLGSRPSRAIQLSFDSPPKRPGSFVLGSDPSKCDVVLPTMPGIDGRHCELSFDAEGRLVLNDYSQAGTQVWYDWESNGDQTDYTWILSSGAQQGFPSMVQRITVDIQGVRFQVVVNDHSDDWDAYHDKVEDFVRQPTWSQGLSAGWDRGSITPVAPLFSNTLESGSTLGAHGQGRRIRPYVSQIGVQVWSNFVYSSMILCNDKGSDLLALAQGFVFFGNSVHH